MPERRLKFVNLHTGEHTDVPYWLDGAYNPEGLAEIQHVLRDHRSNVSYAMETDLLDLLFQLQQKLAVNKPFHVISGYRSPKTNAMLRSNRTGVAKRSLHMQGKAIDIRIPGIPLKELHRAAIALRGGGVGYYSHSNFVHLDVGRVRQWSG